MLSSKIKNLDESSTLDDLIWSYLKAGSIAENPSQNLKEPLIRVSIHNFFRVLPQIFKCTNPDCRCHTDPSFRLGLYHRWTGKMNGKLVSRSISKEAAEECRRRIDNYKALMKKIEGLLDEEVAREPWKNVGPGSEG